MSAAQYYQEQPIRNGSDQNSYPQTTQYVPPAQSPPQQTQYAPPPGPPQGNNNYAMKPSQPYSSFPAPPPRDSNNVEAGAPPPYQDTAPFSQATEKTGARFAPRKRLNDPIFAVLFIAAIAGFAVVSALAIRTFVEVNGLGGGFGNGMQGGTGNSATLD